MADTNRFDAMFDKAIQDSKPAEGQIVYEAPTETIAETAARRAEESKQRKPERRSRVFKSIGIGLRRSLYATCVAAQGYSNGVARANMMAPRTIYIQQQPVYQPQNNFHSFSSTRMGNTVYTQQLY